jgi:hypothetical protein
MLRKQHLVDANGSRAWPLDDSATTSSDAGELLPSSILVDMHIRWPRALGQYAFLSALALTERLVTFVVEATDDLDAGGVAICSISATRTAAVRGTPIAVSPFVDGVGGWATFGEGAAQAPSASYRFSSPRQGLLQARCARAYRPPPVTSLAKLYSTPLEDVVTLKGIGRLTVATETRTLEGVERPALVYRLEEEDQSSTATANLNLFAEFVGDCGGRPESQNCGDPQPIEDVAGVGPDCDGVLTIEFSGCARIARLPDRCGVFVSCDLGLEDVCRDPYLPNDEGKLPGEYDPEVIVDDDDGDGDPNVDDPIVGDPPEFPYTECFDDFTAVDWTVEAGEFGVEADDSPENPCWFVDDSEGASESETPPGPFQAGSYSTTGATSASLRNASVWNGGDITTLYRICTVDLKMLAGPTGAKHNGGVIINFHPDASNPTRHTYWIAEIDYDVFAFRLRRWTGTAWATVASATVPGIQLLEWYRIIVEVVPDLDVGQATIELSLLGIDDPTISASIGPVFISNYYPSTGLFGVGTDRAETEFSWFRVDELEAP